MVYWLNNLLVHILVLWIMTLCSNLLCGYQRFVGDRSLMEEETQCYSETSVSTPQTTTQRSDTKDHSMTNANPTFRCLSDDPGTLRTQFLSVTLH